MAELDDFRQEVRDFMQKNFPESLRGPGGMAFRFGGGGAANQDFRGWRDGLAEKGWSCPTWKPEYGGAGLDAAHARVLQEEMARAGAFNPVGGFGTAMLAPVLLEFANEDQKRDHLPKIARGEVNWCQGYSEPGAGSDLASLQTRAVRDGDDYVINGQKIWTSGAQTADWIFCLVRTDPDAPKHDGISFILFDMKSPGVEVQPIQLISGQSSFCQVFFQDVRAKAKNLVGTPNAGWTIAKRLLQHERSLLSGMGGGGAGRRGRQGARAGTAGASSTLAEQAREYVGSVDGTLDDAALRGRIAQQEIDSLAFGVTVRRSGEAARAGQGPGAVTSMFKFYASEMGKRRAEILMSAMGTQALGWEGEGFSGNEIAQTRGWLRSKATSIEGGTSEIQLNVIAKRVLGLPD